MGPPKYDPRRKGQKLPQLKIDPSMGVKTQQFRHMHHQPLTLALRRSACRQYTAIDDNAEGCEIRPLHLSRAVKACLEESTTDGRDGLQTISEAWIDGRSQLV